MISKPAWSCDYWLFSLRIRSEIELPELVPADEPGTPDVTVRLAAFEGDSVEGDVIVLSFDGIGRYRVEAGQTILVNRAPGVPDRNLRLFLLGSAFGALLHQRGMLPLHANAVEIDGRAIAFMGESGSGKSTLAAWFHDRGYKIICDDVCVVGIGADGTAYAYPGLPRLRLWDETLTSLGRDPNGYERSYVGTAGQPDKFDVPIDRSAIASSPLPLTALYVLERGAEFLIDELRGVDAAGALFSHTYRGDYLAKINGHEHHWRTAMKLLRAVSLRRFVRPWDLTALDEQCGRLVGHVREIAFAGTLAAS